MVRKVYNSLTRKKFSKFNTEYMLSRFKTALTPYILYILVASFIFEKRISYLDVLKNIFYFDKSGHLYYIFVFIQLIVISQPLFFIFTIALKSKDKILYSTLLFICVFAVSIFTTYYTDMLPLHGGGKYLFGASYLLLFFIGMIFAKVDFLKLYSHFKLISSFIITILLGILFVYSYTNQIIIWPNLWSGNPPSILLMLYAISVYIFGTFLSMFLHSYKLTTKISKIIERIGVYSMPIFLYHILVLYLWNLHVIPRLSTEMNSNIFAKLIGFSCLFLIPMFGSYLYHKIIKYFKNQIKIISEKSS